jgi:hypothetical protein
MRNKILVRPHRLPNSTGRRMPFAEHLATHNATHDSVDLHVLGRTYAAVRDLQVVKSAGKLQTEKAALCHCGIEQVHLARVVALAEIGRQGSARSAKGPSKHRGTQ